MATDSFAQWLEIEMQARNWKPADLSRASGIDQGTLSNVLNGIRGAGLTFCVRIADAFNIPAEIVLRRADLIPPAPTEDPLFEQARHYFNQLSEDEKDIVLSQMRALVERRERRAQEQGTRGAEAGAQPA
jgi:transcriptional regulator with XRE-family HTH domain